MSGTDPLTGARYPTSGDAAAIATYFQNLANDLSDNTIPVFASTSARDTAFTAWVAQGNSMHDGLHCFVTGLGDQTYVNSAWVNDAWTNLALASPWTAYVGTGGVGSGVYASPGVRRVASYRAQLRGWLTCSSAVSGGTGLLSTPVATTFRPSSPRALMVPWETSGGGQMGVVRCEMYTDGQLYTIRGVGLSTYLLFDNLTYEL